ncbi:MAG: hypothetical protein P8N50_10985 [Actinomycetota bacterium]|jgi:hypothetical protein|nr:hypothetical protein [Actinomycetota bacterium]
MADISETHPGARPGFLVDEPSAAIETMFADGLTDGLPVVPATPALVGAMLEAGPWAAGDTLLVEPTRDAVVTAYQAAVCAVMAGAEPKAFPIIGATLDAMGDKRFFLHGPTTSTGGATIMIIVSGPAAATVGVHGAENLFGPGFRANATIGRTIRLVQLLCLTAIPGELDKSTQGWPGKFSLCFTENLDASPWEPLHVSLGYAADQSTVTIFAAESGHSIVNHGAGDPEKLLMTAADTMASLGSFSPGRSVVVWAPEHAAKLAAWSRTEVQEYLYEHSGRDLATLKRSGKIEDAPDRDIDWRGKWQAEGDTEIHEGDETVMVKRGWAPEDILVLTGGGTAGGHSAFFPSWSRGRSVAFITREVQM